MPEEDAMGLPRRQFLRVAAGAVALPLIPGVARAQIYPSRPVRVVVTFAAGGPNDIIGRLMGQWLTEHLGQPFVVENRPGAAGNIGTEAVVRAPADGYTILLESTNNVINSALYDRLNFNFIRDIAPVATIGRSMFVMMVHPSIPAKTVPEFIAYSRANPGKINMASSGIGSTSHVVGELFKMMTGVDMAHVPYRGAAPAMTDLLAGQVQVYFSPTPGSIEYIESGRLRALGVTTATRWGALPAVPAIGEFVSGYEASGWWGIGVPKNTPTEVINELNKEINAALADPKLTARLAELGSTVLALSPAQFGKMIADTTEKWGEVVKFAGLKPE
jgi:tripartite-type tricarboxylate transporter receptor subunit TctC